MNIFAQRLSIAGLASFGLLGGSSAAFAQTASADANELQEIVVTAQKRAQKLSDVGITIVSDTSEQLQSAGVVDVSELAKVVSGFSATRSENGFPIFSLRGVNFNSNQISASPAVATYVDEVSLPYSVMTAGMLLDVERIEVLKGPQGTLFGQNATGGSVNVIAAKPTSTFAAGFRTEVDNFGQVFGEGYVSGPLSDTFSARVAVNTTQWGTWQHGITNSATNGNQDKGAARLLLDWKPADSLKFELNLNANYDHGEPQTGQFISFYFANPAGANPALAGYPASPNNARIGDLPIDYRPQNHNNQEQASLRVDYSLSEAATLTSITNYIDSKYLYASNQNAVSIEINQSTATGEIKSFGQELRLTGAVVGDTLHYVAGLNYSDDSPIRSRLDYDSVSYSGVPYGIMIGSRASESNKTSAGFLNGDWEFTPGLTLTGGARYTEVMERFQGCADDVGDGTWAGFNTFLSGLLRGGEGLAPLPAGTFAPHQCTTLNNLGTLPGGLDSFAPSEADFSQKETNTSWRAGLNYKPTTDSLIYGLVSRGYKSGGFPAVVAVVASEYQKITQEELTSYEIGAKFPIIDRKLSAELAAFYYDYKNKQFYTYVNTVLGIAATEQNIPKSDVKGIDMSIRATPITALTISGALTYIDAKLKSGSGYNLLNQPIASFSGSKFNFAPSLSATTDVEYRFPVRDKLEAFVGGSALYNSYTYSDLANTPVGELPSYAVFDARLGLMSETNWKVSAFVRNLTDKFYLYRVINAGDSFVRFTGMPRTYGLALSMNF